jgi:hypothetical protein
MKEQKKKIQKNIDIMEEVVKNKVGLEDEDDEMKKEEKKGNKDDAILKREVDTKDEDTKDEEEEVRVATFV